MGDGGGDGEERVAGWGRCLDVEEALVSLGGEYVRECFVLLHNFVLQDDITDRWKWLLDPVNGYSVKVTYHFLTTVDEPLARGLFDDVWHKHVPLKVSLFA